MTGGDLDSRLLFSTYLGYWFVGIGDAGDRHGRVVLDQQPDGRASFSARLFNAPLAFFSNADVIVSRCAWVATAVTNGRCWNDLSRSAAA